MWAHLVLIGLTLIGRAESGTPRNNVDYDQLASVFDWPRLSGVLGSREHQDHLNAGTRTGSPEHPTTRTIVRNYVVSNSKLERMLI